MVPNMQELQNCCSKIETKKFTPACFGGKPGGLGSPAQAAPLGGRDVKKQWPDLGRSTKMTTMRGRIEFVRGRERAGASTNPCVLVSLS